LIFTIGKVLMQRFFDRSPDRITASQPFLQYISRPLPSYGLDQFGSALRQVS
jgi:hypothetical protein